MSLKPAEVDFDQVWGKLKRTVESVILLNQVDKKEWTERFSDVYRLCTAKPNPFPDLLYDETRKFLRDHVETLYTRLNEKCNEGGDLIDLYFHEWQIFRNGINHMSKLYWYLNSQHVKKAKLPDGDKNYTHSDPDEQKLEIGDSGLFFWRKYMSEPLGPRLVYLLLDYIQKDRLGNSFNENIVQGVIDSFVATESYKKKDELDFYRNLFEIPFLEATRKHYSQEAERLINTSNCTEYKEKVLKKLDSETIRCHKYLHPSSHSKVIQVCIDEMVTKRLDFLYSECQQMVASESCSDLHNLYKLLKPVGQGMQHLISEVQKHFSKIALDVISDLPEENMATLFVENLLDTYKRQRELVDDVFNSDQQFIGALDRACSYVINHRINPKVPCRSPELLSKYCDNLLKKTPKVINESEIDDKLTRCITIFRYIEDKDIFQKFYAKMLAKRLIHSQSISLEAEESMINKLKQACGHEFTSKLHRMLTDIKISQDLNKGFNDWCIENKREVGSFSFTISVLQAGAWPLNQSLVSPFAIPQICERSCSYFETFYKKAYQGRKLTFLHHLGTCEMKFGVYKRPYIATMSTYFMAIFLLFEDLDELTLKDIQVNTALTDDLLAKHLTMLLDLKLIRLNSETAVESSDQESSSSTSQALTPVVFQHDTKISLNPEFSSKRPRFKISSVPQKELTQVFLRSFYTLLIIRAYSLQQQDANQTHASIEEDRKLFLHAAIVRVMKARKVIKHNLLIQEVIEQARNRFTPSISMVKKCIEALMDKQYLERTGNPDEYSYVA